LDKEWNLWDRFEVSEGRDITLKEFMELFQERYKLEITMMSAGSAVVYSFFANKKKLAERMVMPLSDVVKEVSKADFLPKQKYINFEICANDENGDDAEVPYVRYQFRFF
jgi:ubiquitin-activating enzyme E1